MSGRSASQNRPRLRAAAQLRSSSASSRRSGWKGRCRRQTSVPSGLVRLLRKERAGRVLARVRRLHVESREGEPGQLGRPGSGLAGRRVQLPDQCAVLVVGHRARRHGQDRRVLHLPGPGVADGPPVGRGRRESGLGQIVAVGEAGQDERGVDRREHIGDHGGGGVRGDHLGHGLRLDGVPELQDDEAGPPVLGEPFEFGDEILAQRAAGAGVHQRRFAGSQLPADVPQGAADRPAGGRRQVVVQCDAVRDVPQQPFPPLRGVPRSAGRRR